mmetsp:Transcript_719/g.1071  ORF Transcript_719/g.1071 Transcript_719/m.1071 type:complete len:124 (+) Transcript_719:305-676(+)
MMILVTSRFIFHGFPLNSVNNYPKRSSQSNIMKQHGYRFFKDKPLSPGGSESVGFSMKDKSGILSNSSSISPSSDGVPAFFFELIDARSFFLNLETFLGAVCASPFELNKESVISFTEAVLIL